jgi:nucleoid DNA-binding protein
MKKVLLTAMSTALIGLISSNALALNEGEMADAISAKTGMTGAKAHDALNAFQAQLRAEMEAKHAVKLNDFGKYVPTEVHGQKAGRNPKTGEVLHYDNYARVVKPITVKEVDFVHSAAVRGGMSDADFSKALAVYKEETASILKRGGTIAMRGEDTMGVGKRAARVVTLPNHTAVKVKAAKVVSYSDGGTNHRDFVAGQHLKDVLNK